MDDDELFIYCSYEDILRYTHTPTGSIWLADPAGQSQERLSDFVLVHQRISRIVSCIHLLSNGWVMSCGGW